MDAPPTRPAARAWMIHLGEANPDGIREVIGALQARSVVITHGATQPDLPGIVFCGELSAPIREELVELGRQKQDPLILLVRRRADLGRGGAWAAVQAGADDVFVLEESPDPFGALAARLTRIAEIEGILHTPLVAENLVGRSASWRRALRQAIEVATFSNNSLLITGESGTGKELIARLVHTLDRRPDKGKLVVLDGASIVPELSGSEFFGHERGAFTHAMAARDGAFAQADRGTLFLDEVGELPLALQADLLRAVQERAYKRVGGNTWIPTAFRLVCATHRDLEAEEVRGNFRLDFYHRIACSRCHLPPLRQRREDILPLARSFLRECRPDAPDLDLAPDVQEFLQTRDYPGNVRELRQLVLRIAQRHVGPGPITVGAVPEDDRTEAMRRILEDWRDGEYRNAIRRALARGADLQEIKDLTVETVIEIALGDAAGSLQRAAVRLGVTDRALQLRRAARREALPKLPARPE